MNYNDPTNWDIGVVPVNGGGDTYVVVIPASVNVTFDVPGLGLQIDQLQLGGGGGDFVFNPTSGDLEVLGMASIDGDVFATESTFSAVGPGSAFTGNARMFTVEAGRLRLGRRLFKVRSTATKRFGRQRAWMR